MKYKIIIILASIMALAAVLYSLRGEQSPEKYLEELQEERAEKNAFMESDPDSPFRNVAQKFSDLRYYPPDLRYKVKAKLIPIEDQQVVRLATSDDKETEYLQFGYAQFKLKGQENNLLILEATEPGPSKGTLFVAFADSTSARETYGGGRYLELKKIGGMTSFTLDFNKAYNPYCAYADNFSCPLPPRENILKIGIAAGEKSYHPEAQ